MALNWTFIGLSITSSWGNGHATTFRALIRSLAAKGHSVTFLERNESWYESNRDMPNPPFCQTFLYDDLDDLKQRFDATVADADVVVVGSYVRDGVAVIDWARKLATGAFLFYDIDTPVTLAKLERDDFEYLHPRQVRLFDVYCSFSGGYALKVLESAYGAKRARALYCSVDPDLYYYEEIEPKWDLGYLGTYSDDRQPVLDALLVEPARQLPKQKFVVAGPQYPDTISWPKNVQRIEHLPPGEHRRFYNTQRLTVNVTRADMKRMGHSPSVRLFEAAACGVPVVSDSWVGLDELFVIGTEILIANSAAEVVSILKDMPDKELRSIGRRARSRIMAEHTSDRRTDQLIGYVEEVLPRRGSDAPAIASLLRR